MCRLSIQSVVPLAAESALFGSLLEIQNPEPHPVLPHQNLHLTKCQWCTGESKFEKD